MQLSRRMISEGSAAASSKRVPLLPPLSISSASKYQHRGVVADIASPPPDSDASCGAAPTIEAPENEPYDPGSWRRRLDDCDFYPYATIRASRRGCRACIHAIPPLPLWLRAGLHRIVSTLAFETASMCLVICNVVVLCMEQFGQSAQRTELLRNANYALTFMFFVEISMRWGAAGLSYLDHGINRTELLILVLSVLDVGAQFSRLVLKYKALGGLRAVRAMRILRLVRLSDAWSNVLGNIVEQVPAALYACAVMIVYMFAFATLGMQVRMTALSEFVNQFVKCTMKRAATMTFSTTRFFRFLDRVTPIRISHLSTSNRCTGGWLLFIKYQCVIERCIVCALAQCTTIIWCIFTAGQRELERYYVPTCRSCEFLSNFYFAITQSSRYIRLFFIFASSQFGGGAAIFFCLIVVFGNYFFLNLSEIATSFWWYLCLICPRQTIYSNHFPFVFCSHCHPCRWV